MKKVLYHAISAYHLFEVMVHRMNMHRRDYAELILPDFIVRKYPKWNYLEEWGVFQRVGLLRYMSIPHHIDTIASDTEKQYKSTGLSEINSFDEVYVAGIHFYFTVYLAEHHIKFTAFEDAPGMITQYGRMETNLHKTYPVQWYVARQYGMMDYSNPWIKRIITTEKTKKIRNKENLYFNAVDRITKIRKKNQRFIWGFYHLSNWYENVKGSVIVLTQCFQTLGIMSQEEQEYVYRKISKILLKENVYVKKHPDDYTDYSKVFVHAKYLPKEVPIEILSCRLIGEPKYIITISSTSSRLLQERYKIVRLSDYVSAYSYKNEVVSACEAIDHWSKSMKTDGGGN